MMIRKTLLLWLCWLAVAALPASATVRLPSVISSHMVLQQRSAVWLWGWAAPGRQVTVSCSWNGQLYKGRAAADSSFRIKVPTPAAGGPYQITFDDGAPLVLEDILIGEVWVCSGQSNMEISLRGYGNQPVLHADRLIATAEDTALRLFHVQRAVSNVPLTDCRGAWQAATPESVSDFSAVGYQYARMLRGYLKVPVGIMEASWGGTPIEAWMEAKSLAGFAVSGIPVPGDSKPADRLRATCLYNGMIAPIAGYGIGGFIWYQGETNAARPSGYDKRMAAMVRQWRQVWGADSLPFYYVQIAPWKYSDKAADSVPFLREAQQRAAHEIPRAGMVVSVDAGSRSTIHPPDKTIIARRLSYWALGDAYGHPAVRFRSPEFASVKISDSVATVQFTDTPHGLTSWGKPIDGFEVAGADHVFYPATARIHGNGVDVVSPKVATPVAVRYCFRDWAEGNLYNTDGLPVAPFRTDSW